MTAMWRVILVGMLALGQSAGAAYAAPLWAGAETLQPAPPPPPVAPVPPVPSARPRPRPEGRAPRVSPEHQGDWTAPEPPIVKLFKGGEGITLDVHNMFGDVVVVGGKGREGRVSVVRRVQGRSPEAAQLLRDTDVEVSEHANRVAVRTTWPRTDASGARRRARLRTDYEIALPAGTALELKNMQGNVRVVNVPGDVRVEAYAGDVVGEALKKVRMMRSMSGDVMLSGSTVEGDANLQTVSGNVIAQAVRAMSLTLGSVSGNVQVKESSADRVLLRTVTGDIEFAGVARKAGRYELKTHGGDILVLTSGRPGFEFEASTFRGEVQTDVPTRPMGTGTRQVRGSVGDGSAFFELTSFTGDIRLVNKP